MQILIVPGHLPNLYIPRRADQSGICKYTQSVEDGDIVICSTADGAVIKQMLNHKLYSLNKALPYGEKSEDDHVTIVGKVLGKVSPLELPADDDIHLLEEVKAQEVRESRRSMDCCKR